jgi:hypothetical protein
MLGNRKLIIDTGCGIHDELAVYADDKFSIFQEHTLVPNAIYLISHAEFGENFEKIVELVKTNTIKAIYAEPSEGSATLINRCGRPEFRTKLANGNENTDLLELLKKGKILLLTGGDVPAQYLHLVYENFLPKILDYDENINAIKTYKRTYSTNRPYKFLFLNGKGRQHRKFMIEQLADVLDTALWSNLDPANGPVKLLDRQYELDRFNVDISQTDENVKKYLFESDIWGDVYLVPAQYTNTYFSLVTETVQNYRYSFRTEKIWKPIAIGHPWIAVANQGYYRDMHNLGFQTFGHVIDERFDEIANNQDRMVQVSRVVKDLCQQDLASFLKECYNVCKYNQQHLAEMRTRVRSEFPARFKQFINKHFNE